MQLLYALWAMRFSNEEREEDAMPIYEYQCPACGEVFEKLQKADEGAELQKCPQCGEKKAERVLSSFCCTKSSESSSSCGPTGGSKRFS